MNLRALPIWLQYAIALAVAAVVVAAAWLVGRGELVPGWIADYLIPALGWLYVVLLVFLAVRLVRRRVSRR